MQIAIATCFITRLEMQALMAIILSDAMNLENSLFPAVAQLLLWSSLNILSSPEPKEFVFRSVSSSLFQLRWAQALGQMLQS